MIGVVINNINSFRENGFHFIENETSDFMIIEKNYHIFRMISINGRGNIELKDSRGDLIKECKNIEIKEIFFDEIYSIWIFCDDN